MRTSDSRLLSPWFSKNVSTSQTVFNFGDGGLVLNTPVT